MSIGYFLCFDATLAVLTLLFVGEAIRRKNGQLQLLLVGIFYGVVLEWATVAQLQSYYYSSRFLLRVDQIPISIGMAWGLVIYSVCRFSDNSRMPAWCRPLLDGLLALNIDFGIDIIAVRLGMWNWGIGLDEEFYGVRFGNFWAWFWVVVCFSACYRLGRGFLRPGWQQHWLAPLAGFIGGLGGVLVTNGFIQAVYRSGYEWVIGCTLGAALLTVLCCRPQFALQPSGWLVYMVLGGSHLYFLVMGLLSGAIFQPPQIFLIWLLSALLMLSIHGLPFAGEGIHHRIVTEAGQEK